MTAIKLKSRRSPWLKAFWHIQNRCVEGGTYYDLGIKALITLEELKEIWFRDKGFLLERPSIDRIDSKGHYIKDNVRFVELSFNNGTRNRNKTHCKNGHEFTPENTYIRKGLNHRACNTCRRISQRKKYHTNQAQIIKAVV